MRSIALLSLLALLAPFPGRCFGAAAVLLNNYDANTTVFLWAGEVVGSGWYVEIYGGADRASVAPLWSTGGGNGVFALSDGFFDGGIGNVPGLADHATATFTAYAWQGANTVGGWQTAMYVDAATWTQATGANTPPNLPSPATLNFPSIIVLPEPTTLALGMVGAAVLLFCRRRRS